jgi:hypothetical protein
MKLLSKKYFDLSLRCFVILEPALHPQRNSDLLKQNTCTTRHITCTCDVIFKFAGMTLYLCIKAALTEPRLLDMSFNFHLATATWLSEIAINEDCKTFEPVKFPLPEIVPTTLTCVPEFIMGNVTDFTLFLQRFKEDMYEVIMKKNEM